jgi:hypothetical protein
MTGYDAGSPGTRESCHVDMSPLHSLSWCFLAMQVPNLRRPTFEEMKLKEKFQRISTTL